MKILLLGKDGQVGWELQRALAPLGQIVAYDFPQVDFENAARLRTLIHEVAPQIIVNAAAYTAVDKAESEPDKVKRINADAVSALAEECKRLNAWLIHYSTDYVFDGTKTGVYTEEDAANPVSVYGSTKLQGEQAIRDTGCRHLIFRTSWVFAAHGANFAKTILRLARERSELKIVSDQIGAPTSAELIADITALCLYRLAHDPVIASTASGLYHLVASGETSWHGFAQLVITEAKKNGMVFKIEPEHIKPITTAEYPLPAKRPANSCLDTTKIKETFGIALPHWQYHVKRLIDELVNKEKCV